ncbi:MAG: MBL fold metallo-hydrolase [Gammaproteobacteria bacterium]|nr:MBL fold metallo-hydrolase [Gammaproteobacteria bacterium]
MNMNYIETYQNSSPDYNEPLVLFSENDHQIYWLGIPENTAFRSNTYLIKSGSEAIIVDPGHRAYFDQVVKRVSSIIAPERVSGMILCHQDPDVGASMVDWLKVNPSMKVISSPRTNVLLPYYGGGRYSFYDVVEQPVYRFESGHEIEFFEAPFLHFAGAFVSFDRSSQSLFSGDIWAAIQTEWQLVVGDFELHEAYLDMFHLDYMSSNIACRGFVEKVRHLPTRAILPQHGSIISHRDVLAALNYLEQIQCGTDIAYPHLGR